MATTEQIKFLAELLEETHPAEFFDRMNEIQMGIGAVLRLLYERKCPLTAGQISKLLNVSTARIAVLLKKMETKGFVVRETGADDARTTVVTLSDLGVKTAEKLRTEIYAQIEAVIDSVGMTRMMEFVAISKEICSVMKGSSLDIVHFE